MKLNAIQLEKSPLDAQMVRLSANVSYNTTPSKTEIFWVDFPKELENSISLSGNGWLSILLPLAMYINEPLFIDAPVDPQHLENTKQLIQIWKAWYPHLHIIPVVASNTGYKPHHDKKKILAFYSSGIDSNFTLVRHNYFKDNAVEPKIDETMILWGFDIPLNNKEAYERKQNRIKIIEDLFNVKHFSVTTNMKTETRIREARWDYLIHGALLAGFSLFLEKRYKEVLIPSTGGYKDLCYWGSHVLTDHLHSTSDTTVINDGAEFNRPDKCKEMLICPDLPDIMHVCNKSSSDINCGHCEKCLRTLVVFDLMGELDACKNAFNLNYYKVAKIAGIKILSFYGKYNWKLIRKMAVERNRHDIERAVNKAIARNKRIIHTYNNCKRLSRHPLLWRFASAMKDHLEKKYDLHSESVDYD